MIEDKNEKTNCYVSKDVFDSLFEMVKSINEKLNKK